MKKQSGFSISAVSLIVLGVLLVVGAGFYGFKIIIKTKVQPPTFTEPLTNFSTSTSATTSQTVTNTGTSSKTKSQLESQPEPTKPQEEQFTYYAWDYALVYKSSNTSSKVLDVLFPNSKISVLKIDFSKEWLTITLSGGGNGYIQTKYFHTTPLSDNKLKELFGIDPLNLSEKTINLESVVTVQCIFEKEGSKEYLLGSGVIISPEGYILTANHILFPSSGNWSLEKCQFAQTDELKSSISYNDPDRWVDAEIIFQPSEEKYINKNGYDLALLKAETEDTFPYSPLVSEKIAQYYLSEIVIAAYPGPSSIDIPREFKLIKQFSLFQPTPICIPQKEVSLFKEKVPLKWIEDSSGSGCFSLDDLNLLWYTGYPGKQLIPTKETAATIETEEIKPGYSGAPVFVRGNLIGILNISLENQQISRILSSYSIYKLISL